MFAMREKVKLDLFCIDLSAECWSMSYLTMAHNPKASTSTDPSLSVIVAPESTSSNMIRNHQKCNHAFRLTSALASLAEEIGMQEFEARLTTLQDLYDQPMCQVSALIQPLE